MTYIYYMVLFLPPWVFFVLGCVCVRVCALMPMLMWRPEVNLESVSFFYLRQGLSLA